MSWTCLELDVISAIPEVYVKLIAIRRIIIYTGRLMTFLLLTLLTQVGGVVFVISFSTYGFINRKVDHQWLRRLCKLSTFVLLYTIFTFFMVPMLAKPFGRVQLPVKEVDHLRPLTFLTCLLNRNYVREELRDVVMDVAAAMNRKYPGTVVNYLDGNFPFFNGFPLFPHLSHNDGKKLDLAFCYKDRQSQLETNRTPSPIGYGICEEPVGGEKNMAQFCSEKGFWQYSFLKNIVPQGCRDNFQFYAAKTKYLVELFCLDNRIGKIFIEPHLQFRLKLTSPVVRFHGCHAVRHDDHIHIQLK